ncbi:MAG: hypothetical protein JWM10_1045 [Myxococcaceae bacterium]|nr:hypothetical protein [Myxococcaceae bacterium]
MTSAPVATPLRYCRRCEADHPTADCRPIAAGSGTLLVCPTCGMVTGEVKRRERRALMTELVDAARWPAHGDNWITWMSLGIGVVFASKIPVVGGWISLGALASYLFVVVQRGSRGEEHAPAAADFQGWWDISLPLMQGVAALVIPLAPLAGALFLEGPAQAVVGTLGALWAVALLPAALASTAYGGSFARALNPVPMLALVARIPGDYARAAGVMAALLVAWIAAKAVTFAVVGVFKVPLPVLAFPLGFALDAASIYFPLAMARVIAVLLRERADELGIEALPPLSTR